MIKHFADHVPTTQPINYQLRNSINYLANTAKFELYIYIFGNEHKF